MASAVAMRSSFLGHKKDVGFSAFCTQPSFPCSAQISKSRVSKKIVSVMTPQPSERKPSTTGAVWDRDHYIFTSDERAYRNVDILRDFCNEQNIKHFYDILHNVDIFRDFCNEQNIKHFYDILPNVDILRDFCNEQNIKHFYDILPNVDILRDFCNEQNIKHFYDIKDLGNFKANPDYNVVRHGHCRPGEDNEVPL